jgi:gliding motility-associated-like protein
MNLNSILKKIAGKFFNRFVFCLSFILCGYMSSAQAPANDDCSAAITLTPAASCTYQTFTTLNATTSTGAPAPGCANYQGGDVWFQVVVPAGGALIFDTQTGTITDLGMAIYSGTCAGLTLIECDDDDSPNGNMSMITRTGLTPGSTIYIRCWEYGNDAPGTFGICVTLPPPPPANDDCSGAVSVPVNPTPACTQTITGTTQSATASTGAPAPTCSATGVNDDVWYSFVATSTIHAVTLSNVTGTSTGMAIALYGGGACGSLTNLQCATGNTVTAANLSVGQTYFVRIFTATATAGLYANYTLCVSTPPPPPVNDDPCAAVTLVASATCTYQTFTTVSATNSTGFPAPGCANYLGGDVWFQVTVPASGSLIIDTQTGGITDGGMAIYSGDCNTMTLIECDDDDSPNGNMSMITRTGLTPGSTIFIRVWEYGNDAPGTFGICVTFPPPPPANDNCAGAVSVPVNADLNCGQTVTGTTQSATASTGVPAPTCSATGVNDDVWYSFVASNVSHVMTLTNVTGTSTGMTMALYSGTGCGTLTQVQCIAGNTLIVNGLTTGQTYYVRVYTTTATAALYANFTFCVGTPPPPPANDDCSGAVALTVNPDLNCGIVTAGTTVSALPPTGVPAPTCGATGVNDDVWYSFVATNPQHTIRLLNITGGTTDMAMSLYSGTCGTLTHLQCSDPETMNIGGLVVGQTYYVRVWTWTATVTTTASFNICVGTPPPPPSNDEPCNAIPLNVAENGTCNFQQFTNASATGTSGVPAPGCASYQGGDVWFTVVVPCTGSIILDSQTGDITDGGMAIYRGTCDNLTLIVCDDDGSANGLMPRISRTGLTPGETLWVRFWEYGNDNNGNFSICAQAPPPAPPAATCQTAQSFCTSTTPTTVPNITGQPNTAGGGVYGCLLTIPNPTYYYLQIQNSGSIQITINQTNTNGTGVDVDFVVWGPFNSLAATCTGISAANIIDCSYSTAATEVVDIPNAVAGQYYLFLVTNFSDQAGTITYQQTGGTGSSNCGIVCTLAATNNGPVCSQGTINLTASTVANGTYLWTGPNCFTSTQQNPTGVTAPTMPGVYVYTVTATTPSGQTCQDTTMVTVSAKPVIPEADTTFKICAGSSADLPALYTTTGLTSTWTLGGAPVANPAAANVTGIYMLVGANSTGCTDTAFVNLTVDTVRSEVTVAQIVCTQTGRITVSNLSGISPYTYSISSNPGVFQTSNEFIAPAGTYTITTRDSLGCTTTNTATVTIVPEITVYAGPDVTIVTGDRTQLQASVTGGQISNILWTPPTALTAANILNPIANPTATTTYRITVTNSLGCEAQDDVTVTVIPYCIKVFNAFTPNGDGINDVWKVNDSYDCLTNVTVHVFNRYGNKVYESKDYRNNWQGTYNNKPIPDGTYYAVVDFTLITGRKVSIKTDLTILR